MKNKFAGAILLIGTADTCPNLWYATGFKAVDPVVFLHTAGGQYLLVPQFEQERARRESRHKEGITILTPESMKMRKSARKRLAGWALELLRKEGIKKVTVPVTFPFGIGTILMKHEIRVYAAKKDLFPERAQKTAQEIQMIRESQHAAVIAMRAAMAMIQRSQIDKSNTLKYMGKRLTAEMVKTVIARMLLDHNCIAKDTIVACGQQATDPHETGYGPLKAYEAIVVDIFPQHAAHGYWGDISRTFVRGKAPTQLQQMYRAVRTAQKAALNRVRAGTFCSTVHNAAARTMEQHGFKTGIVNGRPVGFIHSTGHGVGLAIHENPSISRAQKMRLQINNTITIEPGLYYPDIGGIRIEDTIVVTKDGWRYLAPCEKVFELL
ncbi:MAG: aminopeptidase P family protein [Lentisphaerae bacterium]|nr:aminopeptidase P family protein [Lentisphaerota bacterium]